MAARWLDILRRVTTAGPYINERLSGCSKALMFNSLTSPCSSKPGLVVVGCMIF